MKQTLLGILLPGFVLVFALGCRHGEILEWNDVKIPASAGHSSTPDEVANGIMSAGEKLGWSMKMESPGHIFGKLLNRGHMVSVDIPYTTTTYSILYKDSDRLDYDPEHKTAHSNLSGWMRNLHLAIQREFVGSAWTY